jgi:hypothetical protein
MGGGKIYEYDLDVTGVTDSGVSLDSILSGKGTIPPQGVRGVDYARMRAAELYAWLNARQIWASGTVNFATGKIHIDGYMQ